MKISITIVHNKTDLENEAQIQALLALLETASEPVELRDAEGTLVEIQERFFHRFKDLGLSHEVTIQQVVPYQPSRGSDPRTYEPVLPPSFYAFRPEACRNVLYGPGASGVGSPRFFNWGLKRGIDHGADVACYLIDPTQLTPQKLRQGIQALKNDVELIDLSWVKLVTKRALRVIGQLKEDGTFAEKLAEYKDRIVGGGLKHG